jgi:hypothetical protein
MNTGRFRFRMPEYKLTTVPVIEEKAKQAEIKVHFVKDPTASFRFAQPVWVKTCKVLPVS